MDMIHICIDSIMLWTECVCIFSFSPPPLLAHFVSRPAPLSHFNSITHFTLSLIFTSGKLQTKRAHTRQSAQKSDESQYDYRDNQVSCVSTSNQPFRFNIFDKYVPHTHTSGKYLLTQYFHLVCHIVWLSGWKWFCVYRSSISFSQCKNTHRKPSENIHRHRSKAIIGQQVKRIAHQHTRTGE